MKVPSHPTLVLRMRQSRLRRLAQAKAFVAASLVQVGVRCRRTGCHCATGAGHPSFYLSLRREGRTLMVYVPRNRLAEVRRWADEHRRLKMLLREISDLSVGLLRAEARIRKERRRRRRF